MSFQTAVICGRTGHGAELRYTKEGTPVASFSVATSRVFTVNGERREHTVWFNVTCWRKLAEIVAQYLEHGGHLVLVEGELSEPRAYMGKDGNPKASLEITANNVRFLAKPGEKSGGGSDESGAGSAYPSADDDIPF